MRFTLRWLFERFLPGLFELGNALLGNGLLRLRIKFLSFMFGKEVIILFLYDIYFCAGICMYMCNDGCNMDLKMWICGWK